MACNCYTKSMFTTQLVQSRHVFVTLQPTVIVTPPPPPPISGNSDLDLLTPYFSMVDKVERLYGKPMADRRYQSIPTDYAQFIELYDLLISITTKTSDSNMLLLLKLAIDALEGAVNSTNLYGQTLSLQIDKINLQNRLDDILSNKNERVVEIPSETQGHLSITQTFTLAPVFNYYILIFGIPVYGVGFDPSKISFLVGVLTTLGINPYK